MFHFQLSSLVVLLTREIEDRESALIDRECLNAENGMVWCHN